MNISEWLWAASRSWPKAPALFAGSKLVANYKEFAARSASVASALGEKGIRPGDRIGLFMANSVDYLYLLYGIWWSGAAAVPINYKLHAKEADWIVGNAKARLLFTDDALSISATDTAVIKGSDFLNNLPNENSGTRPTKRSATDLAWLFYTSGTTGRPKGVMLSHYNLQQMSICYTTDVDPVFTEDAALYAAPMSHGAGLYNMIHVRQGARHIVPDSKGFDPEEILNIAKQLGPISFFAAPTMVRRLVDVAERRAETGDGIRTVVYGGGPMYRADIDRALSVMGQKFVQIYGQGETPMTISCLNRDAHDTTENKTNPNRLNSVGRAHSTIAIRITGTDGGELGPNEVGEIEVSGPTVMMGYWENAAATAECLTNGWLQTGDMGSLDDDGYLTLKDRSKDLIISGGSNIHPREVEEVLLTHPSVGEVSVVGVKDAEWGEIVVACVVPEPDATIDPDLLGEHCLGSIARFKRPKRYVIYEKLPKNAYGKILRRELKEKLENDVSI